MKIKFLMLIFFVASLSIRAQRTVTPSETLKIEGKIKTEKTFSIADLDAFPKIAISDQTLYNHKGEVKGTVKEMKGVLLKSVLESIEFEYDKPKELNECYFVFVATDGYKVVFSWNEIYNTEAGNNFYIVTKMEGKEIRHGSENTFYSYSRLKIRSALYKSTRENTGKTSRVNIKKGIYI
jgi:hypothetical protein